MFNIHKMSEMAQAIRRAVREAIQAGQTPGAVVLVGRGDEILFHEAFGYRMLQPEKRLMSPDTIFDLASLTKPLATATAIMQLVEQKKIALEEPICRYFPQFQPQITIRHLLTHSSGLKPYKNYLHEWGSRVSPAWRRRKILADIAQMPLDFLPGRGFSYSCLNYVVLSSLVQRVSGLPLDVYFLRHIAKPLHLAATRFKPTSSQTYFCAATEPLPEGVLCGVVHDEIARYLGGVGGNAGLFGPALDLSRMLRLFLRGGELEGVRILQRRTVQAMITPAFTKGQLQRGLGWDISTDYSPSLRGRYFPKGSFGHSGFTGTSIWADPQSRVYLIILTNRVHLGREASIMNLRRRLANIVGRELIAKQQFQAL